MSISGGGTCVGRNGGERRSRRRWTAAEKAEIVFQSFSTDEPVSTVARRFGVHPTQLYRWRHAHRMACGSRRGTASEASTNALTFNQVLVAEPGVPGPGASVPSGWIEMVVGAMIIRVEEAASVDVFARLFEAARRFP